MRSHDLNAMTVELAQARGITFAEARRELARRGGRCRAANVRRAGCLARRIEAARELEGKISP